MSLLNAERDQTWIGCVDFGTALSKMVMVRAIPRNELEREDVKPLAIAVRDGFAPRNPFLLPSIVFVSNDHLMFGQEAEQIAIAAELSGRHAFVSPKQYLSTHDPEDIDQPLPRDIDPSGRFTARSLLTMFLAHLLERAGHNAARAGVPWPVALRVARPAWDSERAAIGETTLQSLVRDGFALIDSLGGSLSARGGVSHSAALSALEKLQRLPATDGEHLFSFSSNGSASILEATAVAAGSIRATGRRVVAVADIGGGTSDFGAFMTGLAGFDVLAEIQGSSKILKEAGDYLDMHLRRHILAAAGLLHDDPAARGAVNRLRARARANKEILFTEGRLTVEVGDDFVEVDLADFLADQHVQAFSQRLRDRFHETLRIAVDCARAYPQPNPRRTRTRVEIMLTGGGYALPMARALIEKPSVNWTYAEQAPDLVEAPEDADFNIVRRQLAVAIGGAVLDLPMEVPAVRLDE